MHKSISARSIHIMGDFHIKGMNSQFYNLAIDAELFAQEYTTIRQQLDDQGSHTYRHEMNWLESDYGHRDPRVRFPPCELASSKLTQNIIMNDIIPVVFFNERRRHIPPALEELGPERAPILHFASQDAQGMSGG